MASEWRQVRLGEVAKLLSGGTPSKARSDFWGAGVPWLSAKDMKTFWVEDTEDHLTELGAANSTRIVPAGTTLLLVRGMTLHNDVPICRTRKPCAFNQDVKAVFALEDLDTEFLPYLLVTNKSRLLKLVDSAGHGTGRLNTDSLLDLLVSIPPRETQKQLAIFARALDDKIELNRKMNATLEQMGQALFKSWFVDFDLVKAKAEGQAPENIDTETAALFPNEFEESKLGLIPRGWKLSTIGEEVKVLGGTTPNTKESLYWEGGIYHWVTPRDLSKLSDKVLLDTNRKITGAGLQQISSGQLPVGTVLLSSRAPIGYLVLAQIPVSINQGFIAMVCDKQLSPNFVLQWAEHSMDKIKARGSGTTFAEINKANFRPIPVIVPPLEVIRRFDDFATPIYRQITEKVKENSTLSQLRDELLPKLISGKLRLVDLEE